MSCRAVQSGLAIPILKRHRTAIIAQIHHICSRKPYSPPPQSNIANPKLTKTDMAPHSDLEVNDAKLPRKSCLKSNIRLPEPKGTIKRKHVSFAAGTAFYYSGSKALKDNVTKPRRVNSFLDNPNW